MAEHSPLPWRAFLSGSDGVRILPDTGNIREDLKYIAVVNGRSLDADQANSDLIVRAVNNHARLVEALGESARQIEYLHEKFKETGTGNAVLAKIRAILAEARK